MSCDPLDPPTIDEVFERASARADAQLEGEADRNSVNGRFVAVTMEADSEDTALLTIEVPIADARRVGWLLNSPAVMSLIE